MLELVSVCGKASDSHFISIHVLRLGPYVTNAVVAPEDHGFLPCYMSLQNKEVM